MWELKLIADFSINHNYQPLFHFAAATDGCRDYRKWMERNGGDFFAAWSEDVESCKDPFYLTLEAMQNVIETNGNVASGQTSITKWKAEVYKDENVGWNNVGNARMRLGGLWD